MNEILFKVIIGIISIIGTIITSVVVPYIKNKIGNENLIKYEYWAYKAVECAEIIFNEQGAGESKKDYVVDFLNNMFNKNKVVITKEQLEVLVESCVKEMKMGETN